MARKCQKCRHSILLPRHLELELVEPMVAAKSSESSHQALVGFLSIFRRMIPNAATLNTNVNPQAYALKKPSVLGCIICLNSSVMRRHTNVKTRNSVKPAPDSKTTPTSRLHLRKRFTTSLGRASLLPGATTICHQHPSRLLHRPCAGRKHFLRSGPRDLL